MLTSRENPSPLTTAYTFSRAFCAHSVEWQVFFLEIQVSTCFRFDIKRNALKYSPVNEHILLADRSKSWSTAIVIERENNRRWTEILFQHFECSKLNSTKTQNTVLKNCPRFNSQTILHIIYFFTLSPRFSHAPPPVFVLAKTHAFTSTIYLTLYCSVAKHRMQIWTKLMSFESQ